MNQRQETYHIEIPFRRSSTFVVEKNEDEPEVNTGKSASESDIRKSAKRNSRSGYQRPKHSADLPVRSKQKSRGSKRPEREEIRNKTYRKEEEPCKGENREEIGNSKPEENWTGKQKEENQRKADKKAALRRLSQKDIREFTKEKNLKESRKEDSKKESEMKPEKEIEKDIEVDKSRDKSFVREKTEIRDKEKPLDPDTKTHKEETNKSEDNDKPEPDNNKQTESPNEAERQAESANSTRTPIKSPSPKPKKDKSDLQKEKSDIKEKASDSPDDKRSKKSAKHQPSVLTIPGEQTDTKDESSNRQSIDKVDEDLDAKDIDEKDKIDEGSKDVSVSKSGAEDEYDADNNDVKSNDSELNKSFDDSSNNDRNGGNKVDDGDTVSLISKLELANYVSKVDLREDDKLVEESEEKESDTKQKDELEDEVKRDHYDDDKLVDGINEQNIKNDKVTLDENTDDKETKDNDDLKDAAVEVNEKDTNGKVSPSNKEKDEAVNDDKKNELGNQDEIQKDNSDSDIKDNEQDTDTVNKNADDNEKNSTRYQDDYEGEVDKLKEDSKLNNPEFLTFDVNDGRNTGNAKNDDEDPDKYAKSRDSAASVSASTQTAEPVNDENNDNKASESKDSEGRNSVNRSSQTDSPKVVKEDSIETISTGINTDEKDENKEVNNSSRTENKGTEIDNTLTGDYNDNEPSPTTKIDTLIEHVQESPKSDENVTIGRESRSPRKQKLVLKRDIGVGTLNKPRMTQPKKKVQDQKSPRLDEEEIKELEKGTLHVMQHAKKIQEENKILRDENERLEKDNIKSQKERDHVTRQLKEFLQRKSEVDKSYQNQMKELTYEVDKLKDEVEKREIARQDSSKKVDSKQKEIEMLVNICQEKTKAIEVLMQENKEIKQEKDKLKVERDDLKYKFDVYEEAEKARAQKEKEEPATARSDASINGRAKAIITNLEKENEGLKAHNDHLQTLLEDEMKKRQQVADVMANVVDTNELFRKELDRLRSEKNCADSIKSEKRELELTNKRLVEETGRLRSLLEAVNERDKENNSEKRYHDFANREELLRRLKESEKKHDASKRRIKTLETWLDEIYNSDEFKSLSDVTKDKLTIPDKLPLIKSEPERQDIIVSPTNIKAYNSYARISKNKAASKTKKV